MMSLKFYVLSYDPFTGKLGMPEGPFLSFGDAENYRVMILPSHQAFIVRKLINTYNITFKGLPRWSAKGSAPAEQYNETIEAGNTQEMSDILKTRYHSITNALIRVLDDDGQEI